MLPRIYRPTPDEVDTACELLMVRSKGESRRYAAAASIVLAGAIAHDDATGWTVASSSPAGRKAQTRYKVTPSSCTCYDHQHRGGMACKHILAMQLYIRCLANALDAAMQPRLTLAGATAQGWRGMLDGLDPDDALAAAEYAAAQPSDTRIEALPGDAPHRRNLYDRETRLGICRAQQQPDGRWRPTAAVDTVAWARWLGRQQGEAVEVAVAQPEPEVAAPARYAGGMLERILTECPADVGGVTLKARVIYGSTRTYTLTGYLYAGATWVKLAPEDHQQFNESAWAAVLEASGWIQPARPVKADGLSYRYTLARGTAAQEHYGLKAATQDRLDALKLERMFAAQVAQNAADAVMVDQLDRQFSQRRAVSAYGAAEAMEASFDAMG